MRVQNYARSYFDVRKEINNNKSKELIQNKSLLQNFYVTKENKDPATESKKEKQ